MEELGSLALRLLSWRKPRRGARVAVVDLDAWEVACARGVELVEDVDARKRPVAISRLRLCWLALLAVRYTISTSESDSTEIP